MGGCQPERHPSWQRKANHGHLWVDANLRDTPPGKGRPTMAIYGWIPTRETPLLRDTPPGKGRPTMAIYGWIPGRPTNLRDIPPGKGRPTMAIYGWIPTRETPLLAKEGQPWPSMGGFQPESHPSWQRKANHGHLWVDSNLRDIPPGKGRPTMAIYGWIPT